MFSPCTLRKSLTRTLPFFLLAGFSFRCVSKAKWLIWLVFKNPDAEKRQSGLFVVTQFSLLLRQPLGQGGCELWVSSDVAKIKDFCLLHADPRRLMVTLPLHGSTSLATVLHAPDRHHGEDAISVW